MFRDFKEYQRLSFLDMYKDVTRFEVIDESGRAYITRNVTVDLSMQDDNRTLKVFVKGRE
jgi:hypothetical protein